MSHLSACQRSRKAGCVLVFVDLEDAAEPGEASRNVVELTGLVGGAKDATILAELKRAVPVDKGRFGVRADGIDDECRFRQAGGADGTIGVVEEEVFEVLCDVGAEGGLEFVDLFVGGSDAFHAAVCLEEVEEGAYGLEGRCGLAVAFGLGETLELVDAVDEHLEALECGHAGDDIALCNVEVADVASDLLDDVFGLARLFSDEEELFEEGGDGVLNGGTCGLGRSRSQARR
ncbi:hypothetical protein L1887_54948 [Cichorium endivia]|nr:hypothetical protein L1887_54948 [Cichorium endivia]